MLDDTATGEGQGPAQPAVGTTAPVVPAQSRGPADGPASPGTDGAASPYPLRRTATPFVRVPRLIRFVEGRVWRERVCTFVVFSVPPTAFFWIYFIFYVRPNIPHGYESLHWALPVSSLWITFAPPLMQQGEFNLERLIRAFNKDGPGAGWNFGDIQKAISTSDRAYYWFTVPMALGSALAIWLAYPTLSSVIPLNSFTKATGVFDLLAIGFVSGSGLWGVLMAVSIVRGATMRPAVTWRPFRSQRPAGVAELYRFVWSVAVIFSVGSVFLPLIFGLRPRITGVAAAIVFVSVCLLFIGGLLLYTVPVLMLYRMAERQQAHTLESFSPLIESAISASGTLMADPPERVLTVHFALRTILDLRQAIAQEAPAPVFKTLTRAATTLVLPVFLTLLQVALTVH